MKILYINHTAQLSGGELALLNLIQHLDRTKFAPQVLLFSDGPLAEALRRDNISVHLLELNPFINKATRQAAGKASMFSIGTIFKLTAFIWRLRRAICKIQPDMVHTNSLKADLLGGIAARLAGVKLVWHIHDRIAEDYLPRRIIWLFRKLSRRLPYAVIANSQATLNTLRLPPGKKAIIAFPGIPDPHPRQSPTAHAATTAQPPPG